MSKLVFKVFVAGLSSRNKELITSFRDACSEKFTKQQHQIDIIDILKDTSEAESKKILATPTIIRIKPTPERRIIGDFRENSKALKALDFLTEDLSNQILKNGKESSI